MSREPQEVKGLAGLVAGHDLFLIDQFGVLHDGRAPFPGALEALQHLTTAGKTTIILTNSGKRAAPNADRLVQLGFPRSSFCHVVSSGEVNWHGIRDGHLGPAFQCGARVYVVGIPGDDYGLDGLNLTMVDDPAAAQFLLIVGSDAPRTTLAQYREILAPAAAAGVPALCANPDKLMHTAHGLQPAPGAIGEIYSELGGQVTHTGKPYSEIYRFALTLAPGIATSRILAIGDSVEHDIAGAARIRMQTALIRNGILAGLNEAALATIYQQHQAWPDYRLETLVW